MLVFPLRQPGGSGAVAAWLTITGTANKDEVLTAALGVGAPSVTWFQWLRGYTPISGANATTYALTNADVGSVMRVMTLHGAGAAAFSLPTATVADNGVYQSDTYESGVYA